MGGLAGETSALKVINKIKGQGPLATFLRNMLHCVVLWNITQYGALCCIADHVPHARLNASMTLKNK